MKCPVYLFSPVILSFFGCAPRHLHTDDAHYQPDYPAVSRSTPGPAMWTVKENALRARQGVKAALWQASRRATDLWHILPMMVNDGGHRTGRGWWSHTWRFKDWTLSSVPWGKASGRWGLFGWALMCIILLLLLSLISFFNFYVKLLLL